MRIKPLQRVSFPKQIGLECVRCGATYNVNRALFDSGTVFICGALKTHPFRTCDGELVRRTEPKS